MDISGPCHVLMREGKECDLYLVTTRESCPTGIKVTNYFFETNKEAETYIPYIYQLYGIDGLHKKIHSKKTAKWEKKEYLDFLHSIDQSTLENAVKDINVFTETIILKKGDKNEKRRRPRDIS